MTATERHFYDTKSQLPIRKKYEPITLQEHGHRKAVDGSNIISDPKRGLGILSRHPKHVI